MKALLNKEMRLSASLLSYLFIAFGLMTLLPGYPILMGAFFICLGLFQSFQKERENNDILYSILMPVAKKDVVKAKFFFCVIIEALGFAMMTILTLVRMTVLSDVLLYHSNALMTANFVFLGFVLMIFGCFNLFFIRGFFKTAYYYGKPFVIFIIVTFLIVGVAETLHHLPGCEMFNTFGFQNMGLQWMALGFGLFIFVLMTVIGLKESVKSFERM